MHKTLVQDLGRAYDSHIVTEVFVPSLLVKEISVHFSTETVDLLVQVAFQHSKLLENKGNAINLLAVSMVYGYVIELDEQ